MDLKLNDIVHYMGHTKTVVGLVKLSNKDSSPLVKCPVMDKSTSVIVIDNATGKTEYFAQNELEKLSNT